MFATDAVTFVVFVQTIVTICLTFIPQGPIAWVRHDDCAHLRFGVLEVTQVDQGKNAVFVPAFPEATSHPFHPIADRAEVEVVQRVLRTA
ncbi:hypothetical protein D3C86_1873910 [compost metagenome]